MNFFVFFLGLLTVVPASGDLSERRILAVCPGADSSVVTMMVEEMAANRGTVPEEVVIAVAAVETKCTHLRKAGGAGEWGILQVLPYDQHIRKSVEAYMCLPQERETTVVEEGVSIPVCDSSGRLNVWVGSRVSYARSLIFFRKYPRMAFRVGVLELVWWKAQYETSLKRRFWATYPQWVESGSGDGASFRRWWYSASGKLGSDVWVTHYNYGPRLVHSPLARSYPFKVSAMLTQIRGVK